MHCILHYFLADFLVLGKRYEQMELCSPKRNDGSVLVFNENILERAFHNKEATKEIKGKGTPDKNCIFLQ